MGLDVSLHQEMVPGGFALHEKRNKEAEKMSDEIWKRVGQGREYKDMTDEERSQAKKEVEVWREQNEYDKYGDDITGVKRIPETNSAKYPDHMFKIGYMRSSYNSGGVNHVLDETVGMDLYGIFGVTKEEYWQHPDWKASRDRAADVLKKLQDLPAAYRSMEISAFNFLTGPGETFLDAAGAVKTFIAEKKRHGDRQAENPMFSGNYSNKLGHFFFEEPMKIVAAIPGKSILGVPSVHLIYESDIVWYIQAVEITLEMIDYVLSQPNPDNFYLGWSG